MEKNITPEEALEIITSPKPYTMPYDVLSPEVQLRAKRLCHQYNQTGPDETDKRTAILNELLGTNHGAAIMPSFNCDYGFNIHFHGFALLNYNTVILDTSPVHIGHEVFIAPGVCISCAAHPVNPEGRHQGLSVSAPITIEDQVWIGANSTICGGVTIGKGSVIGAGSVVNRDIPPYSVAVGVPCKVIKSSLDE